MENIIMAVMFSRKRLGGPIVRASSFCVDKTNEFGSIKANTVVLNPMIFNDSTTSFSVYIDSKLYEHFDKLLDKNDFLSRFVDELAKMEAHRANLGDISKVRKASLKHILESVLISLGEIILKQEQAGEKNAVLYLTSIQNKTEELCESMKPVKTEDPATNMFDSVLTLKPVITAVPNVVTSGDVNDDKVDMKSKHLFKHHSTLSKIYETGNRIKNDRNIGGIFMQAVSEIGELGEEVRLKTDKSYYRKTEGKDGILGEACDTIIALTDMLNIAGYTLEDIDRVITSKLNKWEHKASDKVMINITKCEGDIGNFDYVKMYNDVNGKEARICKLSSNMYLVINYESGKILGSTIYEGFDKLVEFVKNCNIGDVDNPSVLAREIVKMFVRKGE